jgi:TonB-linked SusC/RagA family outer membrane protein
MKNTAKRNLFKNSIIRSLVFLFVLFAQLLLSETYAQTPNLTIQKKNVTVKEVLTLIEKNSQVVFFYTDKDVDLNRVLNLNIVNQPVSKILDELFKNSSNDFKIDGKQVYIVKKLKQVEKTVMPANKTIKIIGVILDENNQSVIGANIVMLNNSAVGTITDNYGRFTLNVPDNGQLKITYIGYETQIIKIDGQSSYNISLNPSKKNLDEVVVVGYGTQKKVSVIGAISTIKANQIAVTSKVQLSQSLAGNIPGIIAVQRSGELGNDKADFWIRGISTFAKGGASQPLVLVDGVERDFNAIDPQEIESFSVLKDASATAVYGVRGANGVIAITTKKGVVGTPKVNVNIETSYKTPTVMPDFVDAAEYMTIANLANKQGGGVGNLFSQERITNTANRTDPDLYPSANWVKELIKPNTSNRRVNVNISGGAPKVRYFISASYHNEDGLYNTKTDREWDSNIKLNKVNFRSNLDVDLTPTTNVNLNIGSQLQMLNGPLSSSDDLWRGMIETSPNLIPLKYSDGQLSTPVVGANPYNWLTQYGYKRVADNTYNSTIGLNQSLNMLTKGLSAKVMFAYDVWTSHAFVGKFLPQMFNATGRDADGNLLGTITTGSPFLDKQILSQTNYTTYLETTLNYDRTFGDHQVGGLFLYNQREFNVSSGSGEYAVLPYQNQGFAGRLMYSYKSRYFAEANFGLNGSENFAPGKRFGFFPAVALGWYISEEPFWKNIKKFVPKFKIRGSFGNVGNDKLGDVRFAYITEVVPGGSYNFGSTSTYNPVYGSTEGKFGSSNLTWETETKRDIGVELGFFKNSLELNFDYFNNDRKNIFTQRRIIPSTAGFNEAPWANLGSMNNKGFDLSLTYRIVTGNWNIAAMGNFTYAHNNILNWDEPKQVYPNLTQTNHRLGQQFGYIAEGLYTEKDFEADGSLIQKNPIPQFGLNVMSGDIKYKDVNGDGVINSNDMTAIGFTENPEIVYGFGINASYKLIDVGVRFQGVANTTRMINDPQLIPFSQALDKGNIYKNLASDMWTTENPSQDVFYPRLRNGTNGHNFQPSTWWQKDMSFLRVKDIVLGFTFPKNILKRIHIEKARIYLIGNNLLTFSPFKLWDVELGTNNGMKYPIMQTGSFGLEFNF